MFTARRNAPQEQAIDFLRDDPNFSTSFKAIEQIQQQDKTGTVITPSKYHADRFNVYQKTGQRIDNHTVVFEESKRVLHVCSNGTIKVYDEHNGADTNEDVTQFVFSQKARALASALIKDNFYQLQKKSGEVLEFSLQIEKVSQPAGQVDVQAIYLLDITRNGDVIYKFATTSNAEKGYFQNTNHANNAFLKMAFQQAKDIPHEQVKSYHENFIQKFLDQQQQVSLRKSL